MSPLSLPELGGDLGAGPALVVLASSESSSAAERDFLLLLLDLPDAFVSELFVFLPLDVEPFVWAGSPPSSCASGARLGGGADGRGAELSALAASNRSTLDAGPHICRPLARDVVDVALVVGRNGALVVLKKHSRGHAAQIEHGKRHVLVFIIGSVLRRGAESQRAVRGAIAHPRR